MSNEQDKTQQFNTGQNNKKFNVLSNYDYTAFLGIYLATLAYLFLITVIKFIVFDYRFDVSIYLGILVGLAVILASFWIYIINSRRSLLHKKQVIGAICLCIALAYTVNIFITSWSPYALSMAFGAFLIAPLAEKRDAFVANLIIIIMILFITIITSRALTTNDIFTILSAGIAGIISGSLVSYYIASVPNRLHYLCKGVFFGVVSFAVIFVLMFLSISSIEVWDDLRQYWYIFVSVILGTVLISQALHPLIEWMFNLVTNSRLIELTSHAAPLIEKIMLQAPGTFNHCMAVANFAEVCAKAIGENPYMARAAAYYHDVGKTVNPLYFIENQSNYNPHNEILPELSADIIRQHTIDGYQLCMRYRIPQEIADVTIEHHGTTTIAYFYNKAKSLTDGEVDINLYTYAGQKPRTKIAAIIMICDAAEAILRSMSKPDGEKVDAMLKNLIHGRISSGQLDDCPITLNDLDILRNTINNIYGGVFHERVKYDSKQ